MTLLHKPVSNSNISGINAEKTIRGQQKQSDLSGFHSPFLASSWQVTAITWAKAMTRQTVILERNEGSMSGCQTGSVLTSQREPDPELQHPDWKNPNIPEWNRLLDERLLQTETSSPPPLSLLLSLSSSSSIISFFFFLLYFKASLLLGAHAIALKDVAN